MSHGPAKELPASSLPFLRKESGMETDESMREMPAGKSESERRNRLDSLQPWQDQSALASLGYNLACYKGHRWYAPEGGDTFLARECGKPMGERSKCRYLLHRIDETGELLPFTRKEKKNAIS